MNELPEKATSALCYVGAAAIGSLALQLTRHAYCYLRPSSLYRHKHPGQESWALVTGATDGIGFGFAQELCSQGFNVFLHGRNRDKLLRRQEELRAQYPNAKTRIIVYDVKNVSSDIDRFVDEIGDAHLTVLINNVGGDGLGFPALDEMDYEGIHKIITLNVNFMVQITRVLLPVLKRNGPSLVINVSSAASYGMPYLTVYSGSKGFVDTFSYALQAEMTATKANTEVLALRVGNVQSQGNITETDFFTPTSRVMARAGLARVGCGRTLVWGYWPHALYTSLLDIFPRSFMVPMIVNALDAKRSYAAAKQKQK